MAKSARQIAFKKVGGWGGARTNAGRPNRSGKVSHGKRPLFQSSTPAHVTWRLNGHSVNLRCGQVSEIFKLSAVGAKKFGLRILHYSIQGNHLHLLVEASGNSELSRGLKSFVIRFAKGIKGLVGVKGPLFAGRYHLHILKTPTEVKRAMVYVLQNSSKHSKRIWHVDEFSSAPHFGQWRELLGRPGPLLEHADGPPYLSTPRSWIAREGWMKAIRA